MSITHFSRISSKNYLTFQGDFTLLFHAVVKGNRDAFLMLLKAGADPDRRNCAGNNVLHLIVKRGLVEWAEACIKVHEDMLNNPTRIKDFLNQGSYIGKFGLPSWFDR